MKGFKKMQIGKLILTTSLLIVLFLLPLKNEDAISLEDETGVYSPQFLVPPSIEIPFKDIFFDKGYFSLREDAMPVLKENAEILKKNPDINVSIEGYCNEEEYSLNPDIGYERAKSTREYLTDHDIGTYRIRLKSMCGSNFENDNLTGYPDSSWLLNSRVHFTSLKLDGERIGLKD
jgi:outer membrane protein OmpA-like peptidoglycan-associated protein